MDYMQYHSLSKAPVIYQIWNADKKNNNERSTQILVWKTLYGVDFPTNLYGVLLGRVQRLIELVWWHYTEDNRLVNELTARL